MLQAAPTERRPKQPYVLALSNEAYGGGALESVASFRADPAGAAIANAGGPIRQVIQGSGAEPRRYFVIAPGMPAQPGRPVQVQR